MTVKELRKRLEKLEQEGFGDCEVWKTFPGGIMSIARAEICHSSDPRNKRHIELVAEYE